METALAIYEALIQANVPPPAARRVAESLEKDMSSTLATKQDLHHFEQLMNSRFEALEARFEARFGAIDARFGAIDARFGAIGGRFDALEESFSLRMQNLESRLVIKLGTLMTILFGVFTAVLALLR
jgi:hypothetical protein